MNYLSIFIISFAVALSGALAPGPLLALVISKSTKHGFKTGPLVILGHAVLEIIMVAVIALGFSAFLNTLFILKTISFIAAGILIFFGINMLRNLKLTRLDFEPENKKSYNLTILGITMSIANPYWTIWWLTIGLGLVLAAQKSGLAALGIFFMGHILADLSWYSIVSFTVSRGKRYISEKIYKRINFICALTLLAFGIYFALSIF